MDTALFLWLIKNRETPNGKRVLRFINKIELDEKIADCMVDLADMQRAIEEPAADCPVIQLFGAST